jgi:hypothetical protein
MKLYNRMEGILSRVIEGESSPEDLHDLRFGRIGHLPNKPTLQLNLEIVGGATHWIGETFQGDLQDAWDGKATVITIKHELDRHELWRSCGDALSEINSVAVPFPSWIGFGHAAAYTQSRPLSATFP